MRKDRKTEKNASIANVQGYHGGIWGGENYAFSGFKSNKYFTSDRHIKLDEHFRRADGKLLKGFGLEIETESARAIASDTVLAEIYDKIIFPHFPADLFKMQHDGSLHGAASAECITQVMTREFIRNNYANFKLMYDTYFPSFGISAGHVSCGMHVNISLGVFGDAETTQANAVRKLYYFVNKHFDLACVLFARNREHTGYCSRMNYANARDLDLTTQGCSHGVAFNMGHYNAGRVELRLVGGQKNYATFRNTMESVFFLCDAVKRLKWEDMDNLEKVFAGCNQYVYDRLTKCRNEGVIDAETVERIHATIVREEYI